MLVKWASIGLDSGNMDVLITKGPRSLPSQALSGTQCRFSQSDSETPPRPKPLWGDSQKGVSTR